MIFGHASVLIAWDMGRDDRTVFALNVKDVCLAMAVPADLDDDERTAALDRLAEGGVVGLSRREIGGLIASGHLVIVGAEQ